MYRPTFSWPRHELEAIGQLHTPAALPQYPLDRRLGGPQSRFGRCVQEKNLVPAGIRTPALQLVARRYTDWAIPTRLYTHNKL
jgi:hypothetical protein